ncbi:EFR1 family ferrodoxin [Clostridium sp. BL-8]|uniref:EFR1 family ferrodoxin n=1 Tax=Clostridium sp. BL-8 TaxID=349938 RepID=UPI00098C85F2|nr:EFR1 family ferrodoxin [Clostridium sp. BL-8]OOM77876.1 NAD(P)H-quinone oxidoreductase subunit I [Clostridium sp. BL-8]
MKILYFTATGNNLYIAKRLGGELYSIPKLIKEGKYEFEDEKIGIIFPAYGWSVPKIVEEFLNKVKLKSNYIFGIVSYGAISGGTTSHLLEIGKRNNIQFSYINDLLMIDNYLPGFDMDKQKEKESKKNIEENLVQIVKDIEGERKYIKEHPIVRAISKNLMPKYKGDFAKKFSVDDKCNGCKTCEKVCPVNNIKVEKKPTFGDNCQSCLACIHHCPQKSISIKNEKSKARFINQNVTLKEIIDSNN